MTSRIVPDLLVAVACCVLNKIVQLRINKLGIYITVYLSAASLSFIAYPLADLYAGFVSCAYTFFFVLFPISRNDWIEFEPWTLLITIGSALGFTATQGGTAYLATAYNDASAETNYHFSYIGIRNTIFALTIFALIGVIINIKLHLSPLEVVGMPQVSVSHRLKELGDMIEELGKRLPNYVQTVVEVPNAEAE